MRVQILQHVPFEDVGSIATWLTARGADYRYTRLFSGDMPPALDAIDLVIAMGGPMGVADEATLPWLHAEKAFLREAIGRGIRVLGICLGAQLIASALGARVYPAAEKEIGWQPIEGTAPGERPWPPCFRLGRRSLVFQWHGDTFDLPAGAVQLATSAACQNQAFQIGRHVMALQFHLETTPASTLALLEHCRDELEPGSPWVQTERAIRAVDERVYREANTLMAEVLDDLVS